MQTPISRPRSIEVTQKSSSFVVRKLKSDSDNSDSVVSSPNPVSKTPKDKSPKVVDRRSPRNLAIEKKKPIKASEIEPQLSHLQAELKRTKDQLVSSESHRQKAELDAQESKNHLAAMSAQLEKTQNQLNELSESEDARIQELREISHDRDRAWQSELEAVRKQHSIESTALASATNEIQKLKSHLERVSQSAHAEIQFLRAELMELKEQLNESRENEAEAREEAIRAQMESEVMKTIEEKLKAERDGALKSYDSLVLELEESKRRVVSLEELVGKMSAVEVNRIPSGECDEESENVKNEVDSLKNEASRLRGELEAAERSYREACEMVERAKTESCTREAELDESKAELEELKTKLIEKENASDCNPKSQENQPDEREIELEIELKTLQLTLKDLKAILLEKESQMQSIMEENGTLKSEIEKNETERSKADDEVLIKLSCLREEAVKSSKKAERAAEQLDATQASNSEMEAELRRLKVQSDQWRKAAEAAAAMLSSVNNGKYVERTSGRKLSLENCDDTDDDDDESPKKRNGNVLRKIGVLLKKGQK